MMPKLLATVPLMLCGAACSTSPRVEYALTDPMVLADCPRTVESPGDLPPRSVVTLPDGSAAVPLAQANARELMLTRAILAFREPWQQCRSVVIYVEDRDAELRAAGD